MAKTSLDHLQTDPDKIPNRPRTEAGLNRKPDWTGSRKPDPTGSRTVQTQNFRSSRPQSRISPLVRFRIQPPYFGFSVVQISLIGERKRIWTAAGGHNDRGESAYIYMYISVIPCIYMHAHCSIMCFEHRIALEYCC